MATRSASSHERKLSGYHPYRRPISECAKESRPKGLYNTPESLTEDMPLLLQEETQWKLLREKLKIRKNILIISGAGISTKAGGECILAST
jgi:hypothetical protein